MLLRTSSPMPILISAVISAAILAAAPAARADVSAAARAFSDGQTAQLEGDYDHAAQSFELAYSNAPSKEALRSAIRARQLAGQLARAATLAELLLAKYADDPPSAKLANDVIAEARPKLGRVTVACAPRCSLAVGGRAMSLPAAESQVVYIVAGHHTLEATFDDARTATRDIAAVAGADTDVRLVPPAPTAAPAQVAPLRPQTTVKRERTEPSPRRGLPPTVPLAGAAVAVVLAGVGVWSGLDTRKAHDAYVKNPTHDAFVAGQSKQLRTNILFGSSIGVGAATAAVAIFWTRWGGGGKETPPPVALAPSTDGALITYWGHF